MLYHICDSNLTKTCLFRCFGKQQAHAEFMIKYKRYVCCFLNFIFPFCFSNIINAYAFSDEIKNA